MPWSLGLTGRRPVLRFWVSGLIRAGQRIRVETRIRSAWLQLFGRGCRVIAPAASADRCRTGPGSCRFDFRFWFQDAVAAGFRSSRLRGIDRDSRMVAPATCANPWRINAPCRHPVFDFWVYGIILLPAGAGWLRNTGLHLLVLCRRFVGPEKRKLQTSSH